MRCLNLFPGARLPANDNDYDDDGNDDDGDDDPHGDDDNDEDIPHGNDDNDEDVPHGDDDDDKILRCLNLFPRLPASPPCLCLKSS